MKAIIDIMPRLSHLFDAFQFWGLSGSLSLSQSTWLELGFSMLLFTSPISSSECFSAAVVVDDGGGEGKVATAMFEVDICVALMLDDARLDQ